jgi:hypothetical protein
MRRLPSAEKNSNESRKKQIGTEPRDGIDSLNENER